MDFEKINEEFLSELTARAEAEALDFRKAVDKELNSFYTSYEESKKSLEEELKKFIKRYVVSEWQFESAYDEAWQHVYFVNCDSKPKDFITDLDVLEEMIYSHEFWLAEGQIDFECDKLLENNSGKVTASELNQT